MILLSFDGTAESKRSRLIPPPWSSRHMLYVSFSPGEEATGIELNDHILLRINKQEQRAIWITFFKYSLYTPSVLET